MSTTGPWRVDPRAHTRIVANEDDTIATTGCQSDLRDHWEANARLIAAAPELLAVCKDCMENRGDWGARMFSAIAKAEGKS